MKDHKDAAQPFSLRRWLATAGGIGGGILTCLDNAGILLDLSEITKMVIYNWSELTAPLILFVSAALHWPDLTKVDSIFITFLFFVLASIGSSLSRGRLRLLNRNVLANIFWISIGVTLFSAFFARADLEAYLLCVRQEKCIATQLQSGAYQWYLENINASKLLRETLQSSGFLVQLLDLIIFYSILSFIFIFSFTLLSLLIGFVVDSKALALRVWLIAVGATLIILIDQTFL